MKSQILIIAAMAALVLGASLPAVAADPTAGPKAGVATGQPDNGNPPSKGYYGERRFERMAEALGLSEEQKAEIKAIRAEERQACRPLRQQMREDREQLRALVEASRFDEAAVRALAEKQSGARIEMIVSKARMWHRINAVLTPEQREKAKALRPPMGKRGGRHHHGPREW